MELFPLKSPAVTDKGETLSEAISQGHSILRHDKEDLSRTTGDNIPRAARFA